MDKQIGLGPRLFLISSRIYHCLHVFGAIERLAQCILNRFRHIFWTSSNQEETWTIDELITQ